MGDLSIDDVIGALASSSRVFCVFLSHQHNLASSLVPCQLVCTLSCRDFLVTHPMFANSGLRCSEDFAARVSTPGLRKGRSTTEHPFSGCKSYEGGGGHLGEIPAFGVADVHLVSRRNLVIRHGYTKHTSLWAMRITKTLSNLQMCT